MVFFNQLHIQSVQSYNHQMISSIVFLNIKGEILIYRAFKDDVSRAEVQNYCAQIVATNSYRDCPVRLLNDSSFIAIPYRDLIFLATTRANLNCAMVIQFLYHLISICKAYCSGEVGQDDIKSKFSLIYEILDEVMDYGCPQFTDPSVLKQYIKEGGLSQDVLKDKRKLTQLTNLPTGADYWRPKGLVYKHNDVSIDIVEKVNALFSANGTVLRTDASGVVIIKSSLSGMPLCKMGLNDKLSIQETDIRAIGSGITINDMKFHHCVRLTKFDRERSITFSPPDGVFELMSYRISQNITLPFKILPSFIENGSKLDIRIKLKSIFDKNLRSNNVIATIATPKNTASITFNTLIGKAKYYPQKSAIVWSIKNFQGDFQCFLDCDAILCSSQKGTIWSKPPIRLQFEIPMFTASGLRVRFFKVYEKSGYRANKYHRTITKAGDYQYRL